MSNIFNLIKIFLKKPKIIIVAGESQKTTKEAIFQVFKRYFKVGKEVFIFEFNPERLKKFKLFIKNSSLPILVVTNVGNIPPEKYFFAGDKEKVSKIKELVKLIPAQGFLVLNFDDETVRELKTETVAHNLTFGFQERADFRATDINLNMGTNFKINYRGNIVPIWLENLFGKEQIYSALAAIAVGTLFDLNLIEISQALKSYQSLPGKMRLIKGIKNSWILDDSESATVFSMVEAIEILGKIKNFKRKIAVLGDILGIGKYTIEAHEAIGEKVAKNANLLFTFGPRAKFIAKGAQTNGMALEKIFQFDTINEGKLKLQDEIKEGDLILVDGSKEMEMVKVVKEVKAM